MKVKTKALVVTLPLALAAGAAAVPAHAASTATTTYTAKLKSLNHSGASGTITITLKGNKATIVEDVRGLAAEFGGKPYPHVQHIHIDGMGRCPTTKADSNHDGVISTTEGGPAYGGIGTTLSTRGDTSPKAATTLTVAPSGASFHYSRTIKLDSKTIKALKNGTAVVVVHGLDPQTLSKKAQKEKSDLVPALPLAATSPAVCGAVHS